LGARDTPGPRSTIIQTAGNRMELMPFAQIATRIGGAITVMAALAGVRLPALTLR
jgi:malate:Na+ symporter